METLSCACRKFSQKLRELFTKFVIRLQRVTDFANPLLRELVLDRSDGKR
jgi:hypothetical protein